MCFFVFSLQLQIYPVVENCTSEFPGTLNLHSINKLLITTDKITFESEVKTSISMECLISPAICKVINSRHRYVNFVYKNVQEQGDDRRCVHLICKII